ncbi:Cytochrome P450, E-class, group I [Trema orientale]|uniref:Cytochrome P450, E-class, group I n=1 Tax=Trema orientale TaxID=63057 RepID=A0A2P5EGR4_TREOI|nr:Cytochrome P450, E-class, group I [Trema orientale]
MGWPVLALLARSDPADLRAEQPAGPPILTPLAGTDTSAITIEWAMALLLNHPNAMQKVWVEIDSNVGRDCLVDDSDLPKLNYLQNVINQTIRLFPSVLVILPHESTHDCTISGFDIPKGTMLLVNAWTIHRGHKLWEDSTSFIPERFGEGNEGYKLLPFGGGRRVCLGAVLGRRVVGLVLGSLIQSFEWGRIGPEAVDLAKGPGLTMPKAQPLEAMCKPRQAMIHILDNLC